MEQTELDLAKTLTEAQLSAEQEFTTIFAKSYGDKLGQAESALPREPSVALPRAAKEKV